MKFFKLNQSAKGSSEERLFTFVAVRIMSQGDIQHTQLRETQERLIARYRAKVELQKESAFVATFEGPSRAVQFSMDMVNTFQCSDVKLVIGIHIKEVLVESNSYHINTVVYDFLCAMLNQAKPTQVLITQTVRNLLSGSQLSFEQHRLLFDASSGESHLLYTVSNHLLSEFKKEELNQSAQSDSFLEEVLWVIDKHLSDESFGVDMLCKEMGISERQLQRKLKAITHKSPSQVISCLRLHRAKELLMGRKHNISEVAFHTGFSNPSYFSKCFKKEFGISPSNLLQKQD